MTDKLRPLPIPGTPNARVRGSSGPSRDWKWPPWTKDGDCPLHGMGHGGEIGRCLTDSNHRVASLRSINLAG